MFETDVTLPSGCSTSALLNIANNWDTEFGVQMDHWMGYIGSNASACGWGGVGWEGNATTRSRVSFYNSSDSCVVLAQEIGHNLGWMHAGTMDCGDEIMPDNPSSCTGTEYGSRISPMGGACLHLNAYDKWYQGFSAAATPCACPGAARSRSCRSRSPATGSRRFRFRCRKRAPFRTRVAVATS